MNGGIYKIVNATNLNLRTITNTVHTASGTADPTGAVAIVLDVNKQVLYARNHRGAVVARQVVALAEDERLVCFRCEQHPARLFTPPTRRTGP